jgi:hypothetical protein
MERTLAITVLVACISLGTMPSTPQATDLEKSYLDTIEAWKASEKRTISPKAQKAIAFAFAEYDPEFQDGDIPWTNSPRTRKQTLLISYLDRLRDRFPSFEAVASGDEKQPPPEDREMELEDGGTYDVERYDIARYTVETFMRDTRPVLAGHKGELVVVPDEVPSIVTVDGYEIGRASTISVESAREHHVVVANRSRRCDAKVVVADSASVAFHCP